MTGDVRIRPFRTMEEYRECLALQEEVWGAGFSERVPVAILKVSQRLGGIADGAYDAEGRLVGFVFGITGVQEGRPVHWSDMLAVRPGLRDAGLGTRLKLHQRRVLLERGIRRVYWTFDPLESRNAYLNLEHLGAVVREYEEDMYGESDSPLHEGMGTDRFIALWELDSLRVRLRLGEEGSAPESDGETAPSEGAAAERGRSEGPLDREEWAIPALEGLKGPKGLPAPGEPSTGLDAPVLSVAIPADIQKVKATRPELARQWREATRAVFSHYLERGWEVRRLRRAGTLSEYLVVRRVQPRPERSGGS